MENNRNWLELPSDVMLTILMNLRQQEVLESTQFVCKPWYNICKDPSLWRTIHFKELTISLSSRYVLNSDPPAKFNYEKMVYNAVDRSAGGLIELDIKGFMPYGIISYVASRSPQLRRLGLPMYGLSLTAMMEALGKLSSLEELQLYNPCYFKSEEIVSIVRSCPSTITTFKLNQSGTSSLPASRDMVAFEIAENMPELRHLQLNGTNLTKFGLVAILDCCTHLQSLDLRGCFSLRLDGNLLNRLEKQIKYLRCPEDPFEDVKSVQFGNDDYDDYDEFNCHDFEDFNDGYFGSD